mmetsp:Transcript_87992/g.249287  ORF Transcript_87992/g.249287 Transcript_87992/m.249287 type:complete len:325 (+) Transcript_87992:88-1062(+)
MPQSSNNPPAAVGLWRSVLAAEGRGHLASSEEVGLVECELRHNALALEVEALLVCRTHGKRLPRQHPLLDHSLHKVILVHDRQEECQRCRSLGRPGCDHLLPVHVVHGRARVRSHVVVEPCRQRRHLQDELGRLHDDDAALALGAELDVVVVVAGRDRLQAGPVHDAHWAPAAGLQVLLHGGHRLLDVHTEDEPMDGLKGHARVMDVDELHERMPRRVRRRVRTLQLQLFPAPLGRGQRVVPVADGEEDYTLVWFGGILLPEALRVGQRPQGLDDAVDRARCGDVPALQVPAALHELEVVQLLEAVLLRHQRLDHRPLGVVDQH